MSTHTSVIQEQRWWSQTSKFSGLNGTFLGFINELKKELEHNLRKQKEKTRNWVICSRALKYVTIIHNFSLSTKKDLDENPNLKKMRQCIDHVPLPKVAASQSVVVPIDGIDVEISSDVELEPPAGTTAIGFPKGWLKTESAREVSTYLKNVIESAVTGPALDTIKHMGMARDRNGFDTLERLAFTYGRDAGQVVNLPHNFVWGQGDLAVDWTNYKQMLDTCEYIQIHPTNESAMVSCALMGFEQYNNSYRILDNIRTRVGERPNWKQFKEAVDTFLGDIYRRQFETAMLKNTDNIQAMTASSVFAQTTPQINYVHSQFRGKQMKYNKEKKGKGKGRGNKQPKQPEQNKPTEQQSDVNMKSNKCAWCDMTNHASHECKSYGKGKWEGKQCNRCKGYGHPPSLCPSPGKKKYRAAMIAETGGTSAN